MNASPLRAGIIDTDLLRAMHRATNAAIEFATNLARDAGLRASAYSLMVLTAECRDDTDRELLTLLLEHSTIYPVSVHISRRALALLEAQPAPAALSVDAALVAATALVHKLPVYTANPGRYANLHGLAAIQPY